MPNFQPYERLVLTVAYMGNFQPYYPLRKFPIGIPVGKIPIRISDKIPIGIPIGKIPIGKIFPIGIFPIGIPIGIPLGKIPIGIFPTGIPIEI